MKQIYLLKSSSYNVLNTEIASIIGDNENITTFSIMDTSIYDVIDDASYFGLFDEKRVIIVKDVKYFGGKNNYDEECSALKKFFAALNEDTIIIFICDDIKKTKDITKEAIKYGAIIKDISNIDESNILEYINKYAEEYNLKVDEPAKDLIIKNSSKNIDIAIKELEKLSNLDSHITLDMVRECGSIEPTDVTFDFSNAVIAKNFNKIFELLDELLASGTEVLSLIGLLASSYNNMYIVKDAVNHGLTDEEIAKLLGFSNSGRIYYIKKNGKIYTMDELKEIIINLSELDKKIKTGLNPVYGIKEFLLNL